jgi:hypothetical protein
MKDNRNLDASLKDSMFLNQHTPASDSWRLNLPLWPNDHTVTRLGFGRRG